VSSEGASTLGAHLAEMDRLLRDIQTELLPEREPAPVLADDAPAPDGVPPHTATVQALTELSARLLASMRELLAGYEGVLVGGSSRPPVRRSAPSRARTRPDDAGVTLSAAPFASLEALHAFEQAVSRLPGVREVAVRGYEGADRAIIEVRLDRPTP
jgi:hypothetical protein